jgi:hypothetical protein
VIVVKRCQPACHLRLLVMLLISSSADAVEK